MVQQKSMTREEANEPARQMRESRGNETSGQMQERREERKQFQEDTRKLISACPGSSSASLPGTR